jgi:hypothetical protein
LIEKRQEYMETVRAKEMERTKKAGSGLESRHLERERKTIRLMIEMYCREVHGVDPAPCPQCALLTDYASSRLDRCPFGGAKPVCSKCPIHCYRSGMRDSMRQVMRYAGPRLILRHPLLATLHLIDGWRGVPASRKV